MLLALMAGLTGFIANLAGVPAPGGADRSPAQGDPRSVGTAGHHATSVAIFGGTTQPIVAWLIHATGNPLAIAWYLMGPPPWP